MDNFAFLLPFFMTVFGAIFVLARFRGEPGAFPWGVGYLCSATAFCMPIIWFIPPPAGMIIANTLFFAAFFAYGEALARRFDVRRDRALKLALAALGLFVVVYTVLIEQDFRTQLIVGDVTCALLLLPSFLRVMRRSRRLADRCLVIATGFVVGETLTRVASFSWMTVPGNDASVELYLASDYAFFSQVAASIGAFLLALTVLGTLVADVISRYKHEADHDPMTGLLNRRGFDEVFRLALSRARQGTMIVSDLDHFKQVNDRYGHATGDVVIRVFSGLMRQYLPADAILARFGGEEFVAFLPNLPAEQAATAAELVRRALAARIWNAEGFSGQVTASFGVAELVEKDSSIHDAIIRADASLYEAKHQGRNAIVIAGHAAGYEQALQIRSTGTGR